MSQPQDNSPEDQNPEAIPPADSSTPEPDTEPKEIGGPKGLEPTRYGDWERKGRCIDF
ncbi:MAG: DUF1674 domain-containing protein [Gammaproteobacteria bacterium]